MIMQKEKQTGSAIIWILIAVALFAALGYAFNSTSRTSTSILSDAEADAYATQIIAYGNEVKAAVKRLQLRGCSDTEISFENNVVSGYTNPNAPTDKRCHVFDIAGGGLTYKNLDSNWLDSDASSYANYGETLFVLMCPLGIGTDLDDVTGSACNTTTNTLEYGDLAFVTSFIKKEICEALNKKIFQDSTIPTDGLNSYYNNKFAGNYEIVTAQSVILGSTYTGKRSVCHTVSGGTILGVGNYSYFNILIAR